MELEKKIISIIGENIEFPEAIRLNDHLLDDLNIDSISMFMILNALEDEFSIQIDDDDINGVEYVSDIVNKIESLVLV